MPNQMPAMPPIDGPSFIDFCAGVGGMTAGLTHAGWDCRLAVDNDHHAVETHSRINPASTRMDVCEVQASNLPAAEVFVAGFPCQPFSSSGSRKGFAHTSGHVFLSLHRLISSIKPSLVLFENVCGLLTNKCGNTFAEILSLLIAEGYSVEWFTLDLRWLGVPQTRPRVFILAYSRALTPEDLASPSPYLFNDIHPQSVCVRWLNEDFGGDALPSGSGSISESRDASRPRIGKAMSQLTSPFKGFGVASGDSFACFDYRPTAPHPLAVSLGDIVAPQFAGRSHIRSGRYYARGKPTELFLRKDAISHCIGTSLGGAPLYAVPTAELQTQHATKEFLRYGNWHRDEKQCSVLRLTPERAVHLFGEVKASEIASAIGNSSCSLVVKYRLLGNMVSPTVASWLGKHIRHTFFDRLPPSIQNKRGSLD